MVIYKARTIEARQSAAQCADPNISIRRLHDARHRAVWQPGIGVPQLHHIIIRRGNNFCRSNRPCKKQKHAQARLDATHVIKGHGRSTCLKYYTFSSKDGLMVIKSIAPQVR